MPTPQQIERVASLRAAHEGLPAEVDACADRIARLFSDFESALRSELDALCTKVCAARAAAAELPAAEQEIGEPGKLRTSLNFDAAFERIRARVCGRLIGLRFDRTAGPNFSGRIEASLHTSFTPPASAL